MNDDLLAGASRRMPFSSGGSRAELVTLETERLTQPFDKKRELRSRRAILRRMGDATPWELRTWQSERPCPVCAIPLFAASKDNYRIDACGKCGGSWMMHTDVRNMIDTSNKTPIELARMADSVPVSAPAASAASAHPRACPECKNALVTETLGGAEIDVCDVHGTWFDRNELERVAIALLKDYGLARRITDAEEERKKLLAENEGKVSLENVAVGVATLGLALVGAALGAPKEFDNFGREVVTDPLGHKVLKSPR